jgi:hypothetical protein
MIVNNERIIKLVNKNSDFTLAVANLAAAAMSSNPKLSMADAVKQAKECGYTMVLNLKESVKAGYAAQIAELIGQEEKLRGHVIYASGSTAVLEAVHEKDPSAPLMVQFAYPPKTEELRRGTGKFETMREWLKDGTQVILALSPQKLADENYYKEVREMDYEIMLTDTVMTGDVENLGKYCRYFCSYNCGTPELMKEQ